MNTQGHRNVSDVGEKLIEEAFAATMNGKPRTSAFYLGNWLTDLCQVVDHLAAASVEKTIKDLLNQAISGALGTPACHRSLITDLVPKALDKLPNRVREAIPIGALLNPSVILWAAGNKLIDGVMGLVKAFTERDAQGKSLFFKLIQPGILLKGYFKFVHPERVETPPRMDMEAYLSVFQELFTQYTPYPHLDRPVPLDDPTAKGPTGLPRYSDDTPKEAGLYDYLSDFMLILAGELTEINIRWAIPYLSRQSSDGDVEWNKGLARLGRALHTVEDFFAHSNFVEHARVVMGERFGTDLARHDQDTFARRLTRYDYLAQPQTTPDAHVVTGYFDFQDTGHSLGHVMQEALFANLDVPPRSFGRDYAFAAAQLKDKSPGDLAKMGVGTIESLLVDTVNDLLDVLTDPTIIQDAPHLKKRIPDNKIAESLRAFFEALPTYKQAYELAEATLDPPPAPATLLKIVEGMPLFTCLKKPGGMESAHLALLIHWCADFVWRAKVTVKYGKYVFAAYQTARDLALLMANPGLWVRKTLIDLAVKVGLEIPAQYAFAYGAYEGKEALHNLLGADRIGSHSLLAKDEPDRTFFRPMQSCAKAVHYRVVEAMLSKARSGAVVDWQEFLTHYLSNPRTGVVCNRLMELTVIERRKIKREERRLKTDELLDRIVREYPGLLALGVAASPQMSLLLLNSYYRKADKRLTSSERLEAGAPLVLDMRGNYLKVPVKHQMLVANVCPDSWFVPVIEDEDWKRIKTYAGHTPKSSTEVAAQELVTRAYGRRAVWDKFYLVRP